jgi:hypothetical protein
MELPSTPFVPLENAGLTSLRQTRGSLLAIVIRDFVILVLLIVFVFLRFLHEVERINAEKRAARTKSSNKD